MCYHVRLAFLLLPMVDPEGRHGVWIPHTPPLENHQWQYVFQKFWYRPPLRSNWTSWVQLLLHGGLYGPLCNMLVAENTIIRTLHRPPDRIFWICKCCQFTEISIREYSGSLVECLTWNQEVHGLSLIGCIVLFSVKKHFHSAKNSDMTEIFSMLTGR